MAVYDYIVICGHTSSVDDDERCLHAVALSRTLLLFPDKSLCIVEIDTKTSIRKRQFVLLLAQTNLFLNKD